MDSWRVRHTGVPDLHQEEYTVDELARILDLSREVILHEIQTGALKATRVNHHTLCIDRRDSVAWLTRRFQEV